MRKNHIRRPKFREGGGQRIFGRFGKCPKFGTYFFLKASQMNAMLCMTRIYEISHIFSTWTDSWTLPTIQTSCLCLLVTDFVRDRPWLKSNYSFSSPNFQNFWYSTQLWDMLLHTKLSWPIGILLMIKKINSFKVYIILTQGTLNYSNWVNKNSHFFVFLFLLQQNLLNLRLENIMYSIKFCT